MIVRPGGRRGSDGLLSEINVTPLVDVMLVLLIIFMVTAPMMMQGVDVDLPATSAKALETRHEQLIITVSKQQEVFIDRYKVDVDTMAAKLEQITSAKPGAEFYLKADRSVPYGFVVEVMAEIKRSGVKTLGMVTQAKDEPGR